MSCARGASELRVLVTGSAGFIGRHVLDELRRRGHEPVTADQPEHDVCDLADLAAVGYGAEGVIHLAGVLGTAELLGAEAYAAKVNILGAVNVYDFAATRGIPVVQIGTGHKGQLNTYAVTKAAAEDLGLARAQWNGEKIAVVRAYHVYGPGQKPPPPWGPARVRKFFPVFACAALSGEPLPLYGGGAQVIDPVHVDDAAAVLVSALAGPWGEVTEAGCGEPVTVRQCAKDILRISGGLYSEGQLVDLPARPGEPEGARVVAEKPACRCHWPYGVRNTLRWYRLWLEREHVHERHREAASA